MRITLVAIGSQGDVLPFVVLGRRLHGDGHEVTLATHRGFSQLAADHGLDFRPLPCDPRELTERHAAALRRGGLIAARAVERAFAPHVPGLCLAIDDAADDAEALVLSALAWPGHHSALARGIPSLSVHLQPLEPSVAWPPPALGASRLPRGLNSRLGHLAQQSMVEPHMGAVNAVRGRHGLPSLTARDHIRLMSEDRFPVACAFSRHVVPRPPDWRSGVSILGYLFADEPPGWSPPASLVDFLEAGSPPVFFGFGSTAPLPARRLAPMVEHAVRETGVRAVVQRGWAGMEVDADGVHVVDDVPHSWLLPRTLAAVHHAGAGTTAAALRAGVPSVPVPVALDQPFWARRLHALGAGSHPIRARRLSAPALAAAIRSVTVDPMVRDRARAVQRQLATENAAAAIAGMIRALRE